MKPFFLPAFLAVCISAAMVTAGSATEYSLDSDHTKVRFIWSVSGIGDQSGEWRKVSGKVAFDPDEIAATSAEIDIDARSVDIGVAAFNEQLMGAGFFEVEIYPEITFVSTGVKRSGERSVLLDGDLTIKNITKPIKLQVTLAYLGEHPLAGLSDYYQGNWIGIHADGALLRSDFGLGTLLPLVSDLIRLDISAEMREGGWN